MIDILADCLRAEVTKMMESVPFFTLEFDGSSNSYTGLDLELLYTKIVVRMIYQFILRSVPASLPLV